MKDVIIDYLGAMKLKVSHRYIEKQLLSHPDYPSILSVSDIMKQLGLSVQVGRTQKEQLPNIPYPYLLYAKAHPSGFLLINNEQILSKHLEKLKTGEGVILKAENKEGFSNPNHKEAFQKETLKKWSKYIALLNAGTLLLLSVLSALGLESSVFLLTALAGLALGYVLIAKDLGVKYAAVESFCGAGAVNHCDKVLTSEYSKFFGTITFSDVVLTYFTTQTIIAGCIIPFSEVAAAWWSILGGLAALSIPAILFSLYYQWVKIQAWCRLCLLVVGGLTLQIGFFSYTFLNGLFTPVYPGNVVLGTTFLLFAGLGSAVIWVKELIKSEEQAIQAEVISNRVKYNPKIFTQYLLEHRKVDVTPFEKEIFIGNPEAPIRLVMASNLFCNPCKAMHEKLNKLLQVWPDRLHISFRFLTIKKKDEENIDPREVLLSFWLNHIFGNESASEKTLLLIRDWFERESIEAFTKKYATDLKHGDELLELTTLHDNWVKEAEIAKTPTLILNGFEFPQQYLVEDLIAMVPGLVDHFRGETKLAGKNHKKGMKEIV
jgi:uncharacterized membrane protein/thiol-disulfide isomerase/thioredoxin